MRRGTFAKNALPRILALALAVLLVFAFAASAFAKGGDDAPAGDTTTIGADAPTGSDSENTGEQSASMDGSENSASQDGSGLSEEEIARRKEIYTIGAMITLGAILVGWRERQRRR